MAHSPQHRGPRDRRDDRSYRRRSRSREVRRPRTTDPRSQHLTPAQHRHSERDRSRDRHHYTSRRDARDDRGHSRYDDARRRDRSRDRRRGGDRDASPVRDSGRQSHRRERERERDDDAYGNRDSKRQRRSSDARDNETSRPTTADSGKRSSADDPEKAAILKAQQERQAKIEAWKKQRLEKQAADSAKSAGASPAVQSPAASQANTTADSPLPLKEVESPASPARAKFDPKAIKKRTEAAVARAKSGKAALGSDVHVLQTANGFNNSIAPPAKVAIGKPASKVIPTGEAKITGFGLNKASADKTAATTAKTTTALGEDEGVRRTFTKLPDLPQTSADDGAATENGDEDQEEVEDDLRSDEEEAEAARQAALKRAEETQAEHPDVVMTDLDEIVQTNETVTMEPATSMDVDEEEVDPLDAFMSNLDDTIEAKPSARIVSNRAKREPQLFDEDDGPDLDAVGENPEDLLNNPKRKKKEIPTVDHSKVEYEEIRKNFYSESIEMADMTKEEVDKLRSELDNIQVRGIDPPKPISKWSQCGFGAQILDVIREQKFESPTAIQCQALPALMSGRDTIGIAKTGSGKTLAFILPMFRHIKDQRPVANLEGPIGLIMAPTRELAVQIHRECKPYLKALNLRGVCAYGGAPIKDQIAELKRGAEVVVCTPGRLIDLLAANGGRVTNLRRVTYVVMDEADRMFDMGFEPQITKLLANIRPDRQTVTFSATFPKKMESLARRALTKPIEIVVGGRSVVAPEITQVIEVRTEDTKFHRVLELLGDLHENDEDARSLIFVERQEAADAIFKELAKKGYPSASVHGGREQIDRDQAISDFKAGLIPVMVATSVAARGLDVKQLKLVINFDAPNHGEDYVHRVGRTGRAGNTGTAVTFVTPEQERFAPFLVRALEDSKQEVPEALKAMAVSHKQKVASGEAHWGGAGFGGRGIERLDSARAAERAWEKSLFKTGDEPEEEDKDGKDKKESAVNDLVAKAAGAVKDRDAQAAEQQAAEASAQPLQLEQKLAEHLSNALRVQKAEIPDTKVLNDPVARAAAAAASINSRLGTKGLTRPGAPIDNRGPDAGAFHATLEINDFPQKARWAVTNRTNVAKILEATGTSITSKGIFYAPGKDPQPGEEPKLYILVEGDTEIAVASAMRELSRHLTEGTLQAQETDARGGSRARYSVV